jgi:hypothetical protein
MRPRHLRDPGEDTEPSLFPDSINAPPDLAER